MTPLALVLLALLSLAGQVRPAAAEPILQAELDTSNPVAAYRSFLADTRRIEGLYRAYQENRTYANEARLGRAMLRLGNVLFDLSDVPEATRSKRGTAAVGYMADILNRLPEYTGPPPSGAAPARWTLPGTEIRLVRITEGPRTGDYVFSADTIANLPAWHAEIIDTPPLRESTITNWRRTQQRVTGPLLSHLPLSSLPEALQVQTLGSPAWKVMTALGAILMALGLWAAWWRIAARLSRNWSPWKHYAFGLTVPAMLALLVVVAYAFIFLEVILYGLISDIAIIVAVVLLFAAAAWTAWIAWWFVAEAVIASPAFPNDVYDANLMRLLARVGSLLSAGALIMLGANEIGIPALGLLAGVSIGGIALALAAQSTVENLFGGVSIFADRPFRVGDTIQYGGASGTVVSIGPRSSRIRAGDGRLTTVPNADLAKMHVTNLSARDHWTFLHRVSVARETHRKQILALLEDLQTRIAAHPAVAQAPNWPRVRLVGVTDAALDVEIGAQILATQEADFLAIQQELILVILQAIEDAEIRAPLAELSSARPREEHPRGQGAAAHG